jgi:acyl-CoA reductase-like NAD-dependent aldehyde dehydrogenase
MEKFPKEVSIENKAVLCNYIESEVNNLYSKIILNKENLIQVLSRYESLSTAEDEIQRSLSTLKGIATEGIYFKIQHKFAIAVSLPVNQPLYSLIQSAFIPSLIVEKTYIRPAQDSLYTVKEISEILFGDKGKSGIDIFEGTRAEFLDFVKIKAKVLIISSTIEVAREIINKMNSTIVIYNGSGFNPIIVQQTADLDLATQGILDATMYNSGQDCTAPNCVFVERSVTKELQEKIIDKLKVLKVGTFNEPNIDITPITRSDTMIYFVDHIIKNREKVIYGGEVNTSKMLIYPTVLLSEFSLSNTFPETYCPLIHLVIFDREEQITEFSLTDVYQKNAMYSTVYGDNEIFMKKTIMLHNKTLHEEEQGNKEFGGYGAEASFIKFPGKKPIYGPILISRTLDSISKEDK